MAKTNKELAVELYAELLRASATLSASPNFQGVVKTPTLESMAENVKKLANLLSTIEDK